MKEVLDRVGDRLRRIGLDELNARAALQTRVDSKYLIDRDVFDLMVERLRGRCDVLQVHGSVAQTYDTVYFDSPDLVCFRDHLQRRRQTYKLRSRVYVGSGLHVFEVKMRDGRGQTVKKKIDHSAEHPMVVGASATSFYRSTLLTTYGLDVTHPVAPSMRNQYSRLTLASRDGQERTTVDFDLRVLAVDPDGRHDPALLAGSMSGRHLLVETKSAHGSGGVDRLLWELGVRPYRISKYCIGIALIHPRFAANRYARVLRSHFGWGGPDRGPAGRSSPVAPHPVLLRGPPRPPRPPRASRAIRPPRPLH